MESFVKDILKKAYEKKLISGSVIMSEHEDGYNYTLYKNYSDIKNISPFHPVMKINGGEIISALTKECENEKILFFMKPCEIRAAIELKKLNQVNLNNAILVSYICGGVLEFKEGNNFKDNENFYKKFLKGELNEEIRPVCLSCVNFTGEGADISIDIFNNELIALTGIGKEFLEKSGLNFKDNFSSNDNLKKISEKRKKNFKELLKKQKKFFKSEDSIIEYFDKCLGCHACRNACPVCYCKQCYFVSDTFKYYPDSIGKRLDKKGAVRFPTDKILFHLGRVTHMATSCVACGMCEDVCPVGIEVAQFFKYTGKDIQDKFEYIPGINREATLPLLTFREQEFKEVED